MPCLRFSLALFLAMAASLTLHAQRETLSPKDAVVVSEKFPNAKRTITGLRYIITQEGHGDPARSGDLLSVIYKGMLLDGSIFNEAKDPKDPFTFRLGRGQVIDGWDQGMKLMREGGKMTLVVPYELAYGTRGNPPAVPRQATLIFEIELLKIERGSLPPPLPENQKKGDKKKKKSS